MSRTVPPMLPTIRSLVDRIELGAEMMIRLKTGGVIVEPLIGRTDTLDMNKRDRGSGRF